MMFLCSMEGKLRWMGLSRPFLNLVRGKVIDMRCSFRAWVDGDCTTCHGIAKGMHAFFFALSAGVCEGAEASKQKDDRIAMHGRHVRYHGRCMDGSRSGFCAHNPYVNV